MNRDQKIKEVEALRHQFQKATALLFVENKGVTVAEVTELRKKLKGAHATYKVVKNRLVKRALKEIPLEGLDSFFDGPVALIASQEDPVLSAKTFVTFIKGKEKETLVLKGGYLAGEVLTPDKVKALASLPSKEELYAKLLGCLLNPAIQMASIFSAIPRQVVFVVEAIRKQKEA